MDPYRDFQQREAEAKAWLDQLPKCDYCGAPIQDEHYYDLTGEKCCEYCMKNLFRVSNTAL